MHVFTIDLQRIVQSGRDDFDFHDPQASSIRQVFAERISSVPLEGLCLKISAGKTAARGAYVSSGVRILKVKNVRGSGIRWDEAFYVTPGFYAAAKKAHVEEDDILMLCSAHNKIYIGRCDIVDGLPGHVPDGRCCAVGELIIIRADKTKVLPEYLLTYLRLPVVQAEVSRMVKGQSAHLYSRDLKDLRVVVPSLPKQKEIAALSMNAQAEHNRRILEAKQMLEENRKELERLIHLLEDKS